MENTGKIIPRYQNAGPFNIAEAFCIDAFKSALEYKPRSDDLFIVTYPKCGTTWVQNIVACILRNGKPYSSALEFFNNTPFLEFTGVEAAEKMKRPGAIKLHLPFNLTPYSKEAKYIFVSRNPKDCCVSFFYHTKNLPLYSFQNGTFDDFFDLFIDGKVDFGDYFDTLLSWYEHRNDSNVLFLTYEDIKKNTEKLVLQIAEFIGQHHKESLQSDPNFLKNVLYYSSFDYMKKFFNEQLDEMENLPREFILNNADIPEAVKKYITNQQTTNVTQKREGSQFVRKGVIGDWKNHFSEDHNRRMDAKFFERTKGTDIINWWKDEMFL